MIVTIVTHMSTFQCHLWGSGPNAKCSKPTFVFIKRQQYYFFNICMLLIVWFLVFLNIKGCADTFCCRCGLTEKGGHCVKLQWKWQHLPWSLLVNSHADWKIRQVPWRLQKAAGQESKCWPRYNFAMKAPPPDLEARLKWIVTEIWSHSTWD